MNISRKEWTFWITIHYSPKVCLIQEKFNATHHMKIASHGPEAIAGAVATFARKTQVNSAMYNIKDHGSKMVSSVKKGLTFCSARGMGAWVQARSI